MGSYYKSYYNFNPERASDRLDDLETVAELLKNANTPADLQYLAAIKHEIEYIRKGLSERI